MQKLGNYLSYNQKYVKKRNISELTWFLPQGKLGRQIYQSQWYIVHLERTYLPAEIFWGLCIRQMKYIPLRKLPFGSSPLVSCCFFTKNVCEQARIRMLLKCHINIHRVIGITNWYTEPKVFELTGLVLISSLNYLLRHALQNTGQLKYFNLSIFQNSRVQILKLFT